MMQDLFQVLFGRDVDLECADTYGDLQQTISIRTSNVAGRPMSRDQLFSDVTLMQTLERADKNVMSFLVMCNGCHLLTNDPINDYSRPRHSLKISNGVLLFSYEHIRRETNRAIQYLTDSGEISLLPYRASEFWSIGYPCGSVMDIHLVHSGQCRGRLYWWSEGSVPRLPDDHVASSFRELLEAIYEDPVFTLNELFGGYARYYDPLYPRAQFVPVWENKGDIAEL